jgi:hypothetical protein
LNLHALEANSEYVERYGGGDIRFSINFTSGYRCPVGNLRIGGEPDSNHQYGRAFDFDQGANTLENRWRNYYVYLAATEAAGAGSDTSYLMGSDGLPRYSPPPPNQLPPGILYTQGHAAWIN